jgi:hypothetical protein
MLTRDQWKKHSKVINYFYSQPEGTKIWVRGEVDDIEWRLVDLPSWSTQNIYIIADDYAELRKAIADGKVIQKKVRGKWVDLNLKNPNDTFTSSPENYRIKPVINYPVCMKNNFMVVKFLNNKKCTIEFIFDEDKALEYFNAHSLEEIYKKKTFNGDITDRQWKKVLYDKENDLWDGQPVWGWDGDFIFCRIVGFYNVKEKAMFSFNFSTELDTMKFEFINKYPNLTDYWVRKAYRKLSKIYNI